METVIILLLVGAVLLLLETLLPGMVAGTLGFLCLVAGVVVAYKDLGMEIGSMVLLIVTIGLITGAILWLKYFPDSRVGQWFVSQSHIGELGVEQPELLHKEGVAHTGLRPSGTAIIEGKRVDVVSEGSYIEPETPVRVVAVEGAKVVVRALDE